MENHDSAVLTRKTNPIRYAFGMFGTSIPVNMFKTYAAIFYIDKMGLITTSQFSLILFIYTFIDAIDNPLYGFVSDRTRTRWGRRRPWLLIGAPLLVLFFIFFFNPPSRLGAGSAFAYVTLLYVLTGTLDSLINTNYGALFPELFKNEADRGKANGLRQIFQYLAMIISVALTPVVTAAIGYSRTALIYGLLALVVIIFMVLGTHENLEAQNHPKPLLLDTIKTIIKNPHFWVYGLTNATFYAALALVQSGIPFFVKYALLADSLNSTILLGIVLLTTIATIPIWVAFLKKFPLLKVWQGALIFITCSLIPLYFVNSVAASVVFIVAFGFGLAGVSVTMDIVAARILDNDRVEHNVQREGSYSSLLGVLNKSSGLFTALAYFMLSSVFGFIDGDHPGTSPGSAARFLTVLFPFFLLILSFILSRLLVFKKNVLPVSAANEKDE